MAKIEGYWRTAWDNTLPWPQATEDKHIDFLRMLDAVELVTMTESYRGFSTCRLCGKFNGCQEFETPEYRWPEGFRHYVADHGVHPSEGFREFIKESYEAL